LPSVSCFSKGTGGIFVINEVIMEDTLIAFGSELKALGEGKVGGYLVRFSTADDPDLTNDFFTKDTDLHFPPEMPVLYNHGLDKTLKKRVIGKATVTVDDAGAWAEAQLNLRDEYEKEIYKLVEAGKLGYSSGALSHLVEREPAGKAAFIKSWFVGEVSLTPTPAEPRNSVVSLKSLIPGEAALPIDEKETSTHQGENKMDENIDVKALIAAEIKAMKDAEAAEAARKQEIEDARAEGARQAVEELKSKKMLKASEYHTTDKTSDSDEGLGAFKAWMQTGKENSELIEPDSIFMSIKTSGVWNVTTGAEGGYLVPDPLLNRIIAKRDLASWVRQAPCSYFTTESDHLLVPVEDTRHADFVATSESAAYSNDTTGNAAQKDLALIKYTKEIKVSEEFLSARNSNWEGWMANVLARAEAGTENAIATANVLDGSGATAATAAGSSTTLTAAELARLVGSLTNGYNVNGEVGFLMKNATKWYLKGLTGNNFNFIATPASGDFFGYPAYVSDDMPAMTSGLYSTVFGNFNYFGVVEKPGMLVQRNPYLYMASGQVGIFANIFRAYDVLQSEAIYKMAQGTA
jgi:HK97 family phage major capsid protein